MVEDKLLNEKLEALAITVSEDIQMIKDHIKKLEKRVTEQAVEIHCLKDDVKKVNVNYY